MCRPQAAALNGGTAEMRRARAARHGTDALLRCSTSPMAIAAGVRAVADVYGCRRMFTFVDAVGGGGG